MNAGKKKRLISSRLKVVYLLLDIIFGYDWFCCSSSFKVNRKPLFFARMHICFLRVYCWNAGKYVAYLITLEGLSFSSENAMSLPCLDTAIS